MRSRQSRLIVGLQRVPTHTLFHAHQDTISPLLTDSMNGPTIVDCIRHSDPAAPIFFISVYCDTLRGATARYANVVQSNLTVSVGSTFSFDGAGISFSQEVEAPERNPAVLFHCEGAAESFATVQLGA